MQIFRPKATVFPKNIFLIYQFKSLYTTISHKQKYGKKNNNKYNSFLLKNMYSFNNKNNIKNIDVVFLNTKVGILPKHVFKNQTLF